MLEFETRIVDREALLRARAKREALLAVRDSLSEVAILYPLVSPTLTDKLSSPRTLLNTAVAGVLGAFSAIGFVLFREAWLSRSIKDMDVRKRHKSSTDGYGTLEEQAAASADGDK